MIVVIRDITHTTFTQMRGVYIRDQIIKGSFLLGSPLTVGTYFSRNVSCLHRLYFGGGVIRALQSIQGVVVM